MARIVDEQPRGRDRFDRDRIHLPGQGLSLAFRVQDSSNYWSVRETPGSTQWQLWKTVSGSGTDVSNSASATCCSTGQVLTVVVSGSTINVYANAGGVVGCKSSRADVQIVVADRQIRETERAVSCRVLRGQKSRMCITGSDIGVRDAGT